MKYKIDIIYDGTNYNGWQRLGKESRAITIQGTIEDALEQIFEKPVQIDGSGRTDAGVHALCQTASFSADERIPGELVRRLNECLPQDIRITDCQVVTDEFHARKSAVSKSYEYRIHTGDRRVFDRKYRTWHNAPLDVELMRRYCARFIGTHDFRNFSSVTDPKKDTVRTIYAIDIEERDDGHGGRDIEITYEANGFLYNMVRILTGTLIEIGEKNEKFLQNFEQEKTVNSLLSGKMMPPEGLFLKKVSY